MPQLEDILKGIWGDFSGKEIGKRVFLTPQSDMDVLGENLGGAQKSRKRDSLTELKPWVKNWSRLKRQVVQEVASVITDPKAKKKVKGALDKSWGHL